MPTLLALLSANPLAMPQGHCVGTTSRRVVFSYNSSFSSISCSRLEHCHRHPATDFQFSTFALQTWAASRPCPMRHKLYQISGDCGAANRRLKKRRLFLAVCTIMSVFEPTVMTSLWRRTVVLAQSSSPFTNVPFALARSVKRKSPCTYSNRQW